MLIRNDDVAADTTLQEIRLFCGICDRYGVKIIHAITPRGKVRKIDCHMSNEEIIAAAGEDRFAANLPVVEYLLHRNDGIAVHGLYHTHCPSQQDLAMAYFELSCLGLDPLYYVPPFNEGPFDMDGFQPVGPCRRLEEYLEADSLSADLAYLHSWRFEYGPFRWSELESCLKRITAQ